MRKIILFYFTLILCSSLSNPLIAGGYKFKYNIIPGQKWLCTLSHLSESRAARKKNIDRNKTKIQYRVFNGRKKGWVKLEAKIVYENKDAGPVDMSKIVYSAAFHQSGEVRSIKYSGNFMPDFGENAAGIPKETMKMIEQSYKMIPEAWKNALFWFPEFPEVRLEIGDEFDFKQKIGTGITGDPMQTRSVMKQTFILEDVSNGLAYFTVKDRSVTKGSTIGADFEVKAAGKGKAVFDMKQGMWLELTKKSRTNINMGKNLNINNKNHTMKNVSKYEMELQ
jgi:hypothetical protein